MKNQYWHDFGKGIWQLNPVFKQLLGMCPVLAVTTTAINGLSMGLATAFVLISSSLIVSLIKNLIPRQVRIASYIVIIATFVTTADMILAALFPEISRALGPYVPLIVVNCLILSRQEAFASDNSIDRAFMDALGMSAGFTFALLALSGVRELLGTGEIFGVPLAAGLFEPWMVMILPAGAFISLGFLIALVNHTSQSLGWD